MTEESEMKFGSMKFSCSCICYIENFKSSLRYPLNSSHHDNELMRQYNKTIYILN